MLSGDKRTQYREAPGQQQGVRAAQDTAPKTMSWNLVSALLTAGPQAP